MNKKSSKNKAPIIAQIYGDVLVDTPFLRKMEHAINVGLWKWNKRLRWYWIVGPLLVIAGGIWASVSNLFIPNIISGPPSGYIAHFGLDPIYAWQLENVVCNYLIFLAAALMLIHTFIISYSFTYSYLDYFGEIWQISRRTIHGIDVIERVRRNEIKKTYVTEIISGISLILIYFGIFNVFVPFMRGDLTTIRGVQPYSEYLLVLTLSIIFLIIFFSFGIYCTIKANWRLTWRWRFLLILFIAVGSFASRGPVWWADYIYNMFEGRNFQFLLYLGVILQGILLAFIVVNRNTFLKCREMEEVYEPDTFPIVTPKNIYDFIQTFSDPLSKLQLEQRQNFFKEKFKEKESVEKEHILTKIMILLYIIQNRLKIRKEDAKNKKIEISEIELDTFVKELKEYYEFNFNEYILEKTITTESEIKAYSFNKIFNYINKIYCQFLKNKKDNKENPSETLLEDIIAWAYGVEDKITFPHKLPFEHKREVWKKNYRRETKHSKEFSNDKSLEQLFNQTEKYFLEDLNVSNKTNENAKKMVQQFFNLLGRFIANVSNGDFSHITLSNENNNLININNLYFDVDAKRDAKTGEIINVMAILYNYTNLQFTASVECLAPGFSPDTNEIKLNIQGYSKKHDNLIKKIIINHIKDIKEDEIEKIEKSNNLQPYISKYFKEIPIVSEGTDDLLEILTFMLNNCKIIWFRLQVKEHGDLPINVLLKDANGTVINGQTTIVKTERDYSNVMGIIGAILSVLGGGLVPIIQLFT